LEWKNSIENYLVHSTRIQDLYHFHQTLGEGTFGQVLLGIPKQVIPFTNNRELEEDKTGPLVNKINHSGKLSASG
jgi:hypothetical protein